MTQARTLVALLLLGSLIGGCGGSETQEQNTASPDPVVSVRTATVQRMTMPVIVSVDGFTDVLDREHVTSPIDGTVVSLIAEVGDPIRIGDTVAVLRTRDSEAAFAGARRLMEQAKTPQQRDNAHRAMDIAHEAEQLVSVVAGRSGVVVTKTSSAGQTVTADTELLELVDLSTLNFAASVPLADLALVKLGQTARVSFTSLPDRDFGAVVTAVSAQSDPGSQTAAVRLRFTDTSQIGRSFLRVGMMGSAVITVGKHDSVLVVPPTALLRDDLSDSYTIYTVTSDSLAHLVPVTVGVVTDSLAEVSSPILHPGDKVIVEGNYEVADSTRVTVTAGENQ